MNKQIDSDLPGYVRVASAVNTAIMRRLRMRFEANSEVITALRGWPPPTPMPTINIQKTMTPMIFTAGPDLASAWTSVAVMMIISSIPSDCSKVRTLQCAENKPNHTYAPSPDNGQRIPSIGCPLVRLTQPTFRGGKVSYLWRDHTHILTQRMPS